MQTRMVGFDALRLVTASRSGGVSVCGDAGCDGVKQLAVRAEQSRAERRAAFTDSGSAVLHFPRLSLFYLFFF